MKRASLLLLPVLLLTGLIGSILTHQRHAGFNAALIRAVNRHDAPSVDSLLAQGADPNTRDWKTYYADSGMSLPPPWYQQLYDQVRREHSQQDYYVGPTMLMIATFHGDTRIVLSLLKHGAAITASGTCLNPLGLSSITPVPPLYVAIDNNEAEMALLLIKQGAPVNAQSLSGLPSPLVPHQPPASSEAPRTHAQ